MQSILSAVARTLVLYSLAEAQHGHAKNIRVQLNHKTFSVEDDGRGHSIEKTIEGAPYLQFIYTHLDYPFGKTESKSIQLQGLGMSLLNSLCARLSVLVQKPTASLWIAFEDGKLVHKEYNEAPSSRTGNEISGEISSIEEVSPVEEQVFRDWLLSVAAVTPSLKLYFNGQLLQPRP